MKKLKYFGFLIFLVATQMLAQKTEWQFDNAHTDIKFEVSHMVIATVTGKFNDFSGMVTSQGNDFTNAKVEFTINVNSIDTDNDKRDGHLKSDDFFNAKKFPQIKFKSTSFKKIKNNKYKLVGNLTMRDKTKKVELSVKYNGSVKDPWGNTRVGFRLEGEVNRFDFGLKWDNALETGSLIVGKEVEIICDVELIKKN